MRRTKIAVLAALLFAPQFVHATAQIQRYLMTKPKPTAGCQTLSATPPPAYTSFDVTEKEAYLWFYVTGASVGDVFSTEYYTPAGQFYAPPSGAFDALDQAGNWCFTDAAFAIAGNPPASMPGLWSVKAKVNGTLLFTLTFTIGSGGGCTYTLSPNTASFSASGGTGTSVISAGPGCSWTATSSVTWITTASSGTGNGAVNYTVAPNTSASSRTGTISAGGQTLTITQAGSGGTTSGLRLNISQVISTSCPNNKVIVSVTDSQGNAVTGLTASNFTLKEGGQTRTITVTSASSTSTGALSLAILIDASGSLSSSDLANEKTAAKQLIAQLSSSDMVAVYSFESTVKLLQDFTNDKSRLNTAVDAAGGGGNTALYQAIQTASQALGARSGRKSIVLMTDGEDTVGGVTIDQAIAAAKNAGVPIFPVGFGSADTAILTRIATETGGFYTASANSADLQRILQSLGQVISSQYEISYTSGSPSIDNTIDITVSSGGQTATASRTVAKCSGGTTPTGLQINISQVVDSACPNNKIIVSVMSGGTAVTGLTAANFTLKEGGAIRAVTVTSAGGSSTGALSLAILIDASGSLSGTDLANEKSAAKQLIAQLSSSDMVAVYSFESTVKLLQDFTNDKSRLNAAVDAAGGGGSTALYKAIQTASQALGARAGRKSIVLMTDGEDTIGGATIDDAINAAKTAGVPIFPVGFGSADTAILTRIANETGGFYSQSASSADLQRILQSLGQIISSQYEISYTSGSPSTDNTVEITVSYGGQTATATRVVSKCSGGGTPGCTYLVQPQSITVPAAGSQGTVIVITQSGCALNPSANVSWIHVLGSNQGAVSYQVDPNTSGGPRSGILTIGNRQIPVTQDGGTSCTYSLSPSSNQVQSLGTTSSFRLSTGPGCAWTAGTGTGWLHVTSSTSGSGSATITYTVDVNTSTQPRGGTITVAGLTYTVNQSGGAPPNTPTIADGGIVNAASNRMGPVARGSFFTIYGSNLGPPGYLQVDRYPIPDTMGGVVVTVSQGSYSRRAYLHFVSAAQINGILPSDTPLGNVQLTVNYNGMVGSSSTIQVVDTSFGVFSAAGGPGPGIVQNYNSAADVPLNMASFPAKPRQIVILWGTGLGPITTGDNNPPPGGDLAVPVEVRVGGKLATRLYSGRAPNFAGVDNIYFEVPADAPLGCAVPIQVTAANSVSNTVRMAISADGKRCQDSANPFGNTVSTGGKTGVLSLLRVSVKGQLDSTKPAVDATFDQGVGVFSKVAAGTELSFSPFMSLPPVGTCTSNSKGVDFGSIIGTGGTSLDSTSQGLLDAGTTLSVTGPNGTMKIEHVDPNTSSGPYLSTLGGTMPVDGAQQLPLFLDAGSYSISGSGGKDIGAFSTSLSLPAAVTWTNQGQVNSIVRSAGLTVTWTGGDDTQTVAIVGGSSNQKTKESGGFMCLAPASAGSFTVPAHVLADMPATGSTTSMSDTIGMVALWTLPLGNPQKFTAPGLDSGFVFSSSISAKAVQVQ